MRISADRRAQDHAKQKLDLLIRYAQTHRCRRQQILDYFGDEQEIQRLRLRHLRRDVEPLEEAPRERAVGGRRRHAGATTPLGDRAAGAGSLASGSWRRCSPGRRTKKPSGWQFDQLSVYGLLKVHSIKRIIAMLHRLMEAGLAKQKDPDGVKFRPWSN